VGRRREDEPPALIGVTLVAELVTDAPPARVAGIVERALRTGTITRTVGRAVSLEIVIRVNDTVVPVQVPAWADRG
jgi:hypothetical protein